MRILAWLRQHRVAANLIGAGCCVALLGYALFAQYGLGLEPCPLCIFQRVAVASLGLAFLLGALLALPRGRWGGWLAMLLIASATAAGAGVAGRHVYIQSQPAGSIPACGADLGYLLEAFPLWDVLQKVLSASGECATIDWSFLGITMPGWVLISVLGLGAAGLLVNWPSRRVPAGG